MHRPTRPKATCHSHPAVQILIAGSFKAIHLPQGTQSRYSDSSRIARHPIHHSSGYKVEMQYLHSLFIAFSFKEVGKSLNLVEIHML